MTVVLDTTVLIDHLREVESARVLLRDLLGSDQRVCASVLTKIEVMAGRQPAEERALEYLLHQIEWVDVDGEVADRAGDFAHTFQRSHRDIEVVDYVIAATADLLGAEVCTRNVKHFPMFPELEPPY